MVSPLEHAHDRFLRAEGGFMHFGCINPFCCHGNPGLPNHWEAPLSTSAVDIEVTSHKDRKVTFNVRLKKDLGKHKTGETITITCADNLEACKAEFDKLFKEAQT